MAVVNELVSRFSFLGSLAPQEQFNEGLAQSITLLGGVATATIAATGAFFAWAGSVLSTIDPLAQLNRETGASVEQIQALGYAASVNGSSLDAVSSSLRELSKRAGEFVQEGGGPAKEIIEKLGLSMKDAQGKIKGTDQLLLDVAGKLRGLSQGEKMNVLDKLGIDQSLIQTLSLTDEELGKLMARAKGFGLLTQDQVDAAAAYEDSLTTLKFAMQSVQNTVAVGFAPAMTDLIDKFVSFIETNQELIQGGLKWLGDVLLSVSGFIGRMTPIVLVLAGAFAVATLASGGFAAIMGVILSPVVLITTAIVALLLIVDDLIVAFNGGQSVIADFFNEFLGIDIVPIMHGVVDAFMAMVDTVIELIGNLWDAWTQFTTAIVQLFTGEWGAALDSLLGAFNSLGTAIKSVFTGVFDFLFAGMSQIFGAIKSAAASMLPDWAVRLLGGDDSAVPGGAPGSGGTPTAMPSGSGQDVLDVPMITPNEAVGIGSTSNSSVSNNSVEQNVTQNIYSSDPQQAGAAAANGLQDQLKTAKTQVNRGGR